MMEHDGRSKGCGIVSFTGPRDATNAIATLNQSELGGRVIFVREDREESGGNGHVIGGGLPAPGTRSPALAPVHHAPAPVFGGGLPPARGVGGGGRGGGGRGGGGFASGGGGAVAVAGGGGTRVYVGNLSWETSWQDLKDHFRAAGDVSHADVMMEHDGRSKGCGIVSFASARDAGNAIASLHDSELHGRKIFVREDREANAPTGGKGKGSGTGGCQVYVGNLPWETNWMNLKDHFREAGGVLHADVVLDPEGKSRGFGTVLFGTTRDAAKAIQLFNESLFAGRTIEVRPDQFR